MTRKTLLSFSSLVLLTAVVLIQESAASAQATSGSAKTASSTSAAPKGSGTSAPAASSSASPRGGHWLSNCSREEAGHLAGWASTFKCPAGTSEKTDGGFSNCVDASGKRTGLSRLVANGKVTRADLYEGGDLVRIVKIHPNGKPSVLREFDKGMVHCTKFWKDDGKEDPNGVWGP